MTQDHPNNENERPKLFVYEEGRLYFTKKMERKIFFFMTIVMLLTGVIRYSLGS